MACDIDKQARTAMLAARWLHTRVVPECDMLCKKIHMYGQGTHARIAAGAGGSEHSKNK